VEGFMVPERLREEMLVRASVALKGLRNTDIENCRMCSIYTMPNRAQSHEY
jgi:hypothetical protein